MIDTSLRQQNKLQQGDGRRAFLPKPKPTNVAGLSRAEIRSLIEDTGIIPRVDNLSCEEALFVADALLAADVPILEISLNGFDAVDVISDLAKHMPTMIVGGGSVRNLEGAQKALDAGAKFFSMDALIPSVVEYAAKAGVVVIPGALTLSEIAAAWNSGPDFVKVVPCHAVGAARYIRTVSDALPEVRLVAAGGVNLLNAQEYASTGVAALSLGKELIPPEAVFQRHSERVKELARRFLLALDRGRV